MRSLSQFVVACGVLVLCSCSRGDSEQVAKLKTELEAARAEAAAAQAELAKLKAAMNPPHKAQSEETEVLECGIGFVADVEQNRLASAYRSTSAAYQKQVERKVFDAMIEKHGIKPLETITHRQHKVTKLPGGKGYEFYCTARELNAREFGGPRALNLNDPGVGPRVNFALTISSENGAWKISTLEITVEKGK